MLLKKYKASDLASALAKAQAELGPDALVLETRKVRAGLGLEGIELTVGAPRRFASHAIGNGTGALRRLAHEIRELRDRSDLQAEFAPVQPPLTPNTSISGDDTIRATVDLLVASGLSRDLAARFTLEAERELARGGGAGGAVRAARKGMSAVLSFARLPASSRCLFIVGPPGCGKTTTTAKLAARATARNTGRVTFATADGDRIGAMEQAAVFSRHLGADLAPVRSQDDLLRALDDAGGRPVLVDTPGIGAGDAGRLDQLAALRAGVPEADMALLLPAGIQGEEATRILERFRPLEPSCLAFSRVDDGGRLGELVTAAATSEIPLAIFTHGHRVPDDIADASPLALTNMMLRTESVSVAGRERR
jgi:flagellar biosynthesis protein FlhF